MPQKIKTDELQPLTEAQAEQIRDYVDKLTGKRVSKWDAIPLGWENTWDIDVTPELVILYADGVEDYSPWYEAWGLYGGPKGKSPFGPAIAPPLLPSHNGNGFFMTEELKGGMPGNIHVYHNSDIIEPIFIGTHLRFHGKLVGKFIKRDRQYHRIEVTCTNTDTGKVVFRETREELLQYRKISEQGGKE